MGKFLVELECILLIRLLDSAQPTTIRSIKHQFLKGYYGVLMTS